MPFEHAIDQQQRLIIIRGSGSGSIEETEDSAGRLICSLADRTILPGYRTLINVDAIELVPKADETMRIAELIIMLQCHLRGPIAIVASTNGKTTPAHLMAAYSSGLNGKVGAFLTESEALAWLLELPGL